MATKGDNAGLSGRRRGWAEKRDILIEGENAYGF